MVLGVDAQVSKGNRLKFFERADFHGSKIDTNIATLFISVILMNIPFYKLRWN